MHECPKTHFKHKCMHSSHHATSSCHVTMPCHHTTSSCHVSMPHHHATSSCHVSMPHHHDTLSCHVSMPHHHAMSSCLYSTDATCHPISGATWHLHFAKFACFTNTTECDNFLIRSPFEVKRTPLESSRWALRYGVGFADIGVLQKFFLLGSSWMRPWK